MKLLISLLLLVFTASCQDGVSTLNVYRLRLYQARLRKITVLCDGKEVARVANGGYVTLKLSPGQHMLKDKKYPASVTFTAEAGREYFMRVEWQGGLWSMQPRFSLTEPEQGRADLNQLTASK